MAANLIRLFKDQVGDPITSWASASLDAEPESVARGWEATLPVLLGLLAQRAGTKQGALLLAERLKQPENDGRLLSQLPEALQGEHGEELRRRGQALLDEWVGADQPALIQLLAQHTGLDKKKIARLLQVVLPTLINLLGQRFRRQRQDLGELMNDLSEQIPFVQNALPAELGNPMARSGLKGILNDLSAQKNKNQSSMQSETTNGSRPSGQNRKWLPMLLGALIVVALIYFLLPWGDEPAADNTPTFETPAQGPPPEPAIQEPPASLVGEANIMTIMMDMVENGGSMVNQTYVMENSDFAEGSAELTDAIRTEALGLAYVLGQNPGMEVRITAHTADNLDLAIQRSEAIRQVVIEEGNISSNRVFARGDQTTAGNTNRVEVTILAQ